MDLMEPCGEAGRDRAYLRRRRIIDAARTLFVDNGFHATGVAQIAKASGVAVGQLYRDFASKEDVVAAIVEGDCYAVMKRESLHRAIADGDAGPVWAWLHEFLRADTQDGTDLLFAEIVAESTRNHRIAAIFARVQAEVNADMLAALALLAPGEHHAARRELLADFVLAQSLGIIQSRLLRPDLDTDRLVGLALAAITREVDALTGS